MRDDSIAWCIVVWVVLLLDIDLCEPVTVGEMIVASTNSLEWLVDSIVVTVL